MMKGLLLHVLFHITVSECVFFPNDKTSVCVRPQRVIMSGRLECL